MSSMSGYITYLKYTVGQGKGDVEAGRVLRDPFHEGKPQSEYTSAKVTQTLDAEMTLANVADFKPELSTVTVVKVDGTILRAKEVNGNEITLTDAPVKFEVERNGNVERVFGETETADVTITIDTDGTITGLAEGDKVSYIYNNIVVPQAALPTIKAEMDSMPLLAKARRIAVFYSQIAA